MRILYLPHTSSPTILHTDHGYAWAQTFFGNWLRAKPKNILYWVVPTGTKEKQMNAFEKLDDVLDRIILIEADCSRWQMVEQNVLPDIVGNSFNCVDGPFFFDCLFTEKTGTISQFLAKSWVWPQLRPYKIIVGSFQYMMDVDRRDNILLDYELQQMMGTASCDYLQFVSPVDQTDCYQRWRIKIRRYLSSDLVHKLEQLPHNYKCYANLPYVENIRKSSTVERSKEMFQIHFGSGANSQNNFMKVYKAAESLYMMNDKTKLLITSPSKGGFVLKHIDGSFVEMKLQCPRDEFLRRALESHCFIWWHDLIGANSGSMWEMCMLGVLPIFHAKAPAYPWCFMKEPYKFVFNSETELLALLKWVRDYWHSPRVQDEIKRSQEMLWDYYNGECSNQKRWEWIEAEHAKRLKTKLTFPFLSLLKGMPDKFTMKEATDYIKEHSDTKKELGVGAAGIPGMSMFTRDFLRTVLLQNGWEDTGGAYEPYFERVKDEAELVTA